MRLRLLPSSDRVVADPHDVRLAHRLPTRLTGKPDLSIGTWDDTVEGRGGDIPVRVYARPDLAPDSPVVLFIHGGGFVDFGLEVSDTFCRAFAAKSGYVVVSVTYRLAPEHPFPAGLEDCEDVLSWIVRTRPQGCDAERIAVCGESAGGNLTAALCLSSRDRGGPRVAHMTTIHPVTDPTLSSPDWDRGAIPGMDRPAAEAMFAAYAPGNALHPYVDVLHADLRGLPPSHVLSCEHDPARTDSIRFAEALEAAGVPTTHHHYDNMPHGYLMLRGVLREADESLGHIVAELHRTFARAGTGLAT